MMRWRCSSASRSSSGLVSGNTGTVRIAGSSEASGPAFMYSRARLLLWTIPRTLSGLSFSTTTSRVCPDDTQRRRPSLTVSSAFTVTTAGIGVITSRASCSCR